MGFKEDFMKKTKMLDVNGGKAGVEEVMNFLVKPESVFKMIIASEMDLPVLTLIGAELERKFDAHSNFPVIYLGNDKNPTARQNVGRMVKVVMAQYGYTPVDGGLSEQARIPAISGTDYFSTSGIYKKTDEAKLEIEIISREI
ncbi:hypothetical protein QA584_04075 [Anaerocolumna sp. AGMB13025]|uniref:hypothetical protein n=1 Tax=Anaerocolumna sp. AGMB13025 TaxID=3039116 RepID=UPI00241C0BC2|nr:hypothetical protein [Anaerocolumna sp. AGMB13025]WFR58253.1 hypothetical protein QA584_04075 [Anaerocolumna sp. AGMB13025]